MVNVTLPDGSVRQFDAPVTVAQVASSIGAGLATQIIAVGNPALAQKLRDERAANAEAIRAKDAALQESLRG